MTGSRADQNEEGQAGRPEELPPVHREGVKSRTHKNYYTIMHLYCIWAVVVANGR